MNVAVLGDGMLGSEIVKQTGWDYFSRKKDNIEVLDVQTWSQLLLPYDTIINCIAHTKTYDKYRDINWKINYEFVAKLVDYCQLHGKKIIHISTDYIYSNSKIEASEEDVPVHANTWYCYTKLLADGYVQLKSKNYLICRESHKPYPFPYKSAWIDQHTTGDYVNVIADLIIQLIKKNAIGIYNVGTNVKTWYHHTKEEFGTSIGFRGDEVPENITMNVNKLKNFLS